MKIKKYVDTAIKREVRRCQLIKLRRDTNRYIKRFIDADFSSAVDNVQEVIKKIIEVVKNILSSAGESISSGVKKAFSQVASVAKSIGNALVSLKDKIPLPKKKSIIQKIGAKLSELEKFVKKQPVSASVIASLVALLGVAIWRIKGILSMLRDIGVD